jgi:colanic acid/amylovoran biosynthesis glycosyltransferase
VPDPRPTSVHLIRAYLDRSEVFVHTQISAISKYDVKVLTRRRAPWSDELFPFPSVADYGSTHRSLGKVASNVGYRLIRRLSASEALWYENRISDCAPAVLHVHFAVDAAYFSPILDGARVPSVVSCYGYDVSGFPLRYRGRGRQYLQRAFKSADLFLAMSEDMRSDIVALGCPPEKVIVHYHGINLARFPLADRSPRDSGSVRLLFVGALIDKKGVLDVLGAFRMLARDYPNLELRFVGRGPREATLRQRADAAGLGDRVTFSGYVPNARLAAEFAEADVFCHPSNVDAHGNKEGIPGTIVEAASSGLPVVSTRHAGIPVVVEDGATGLLVAEHDVEALARAIAWLAEHRQRRVEMGRAGSALVREVADAQKQAARLEEVYDQISAKG